MMDICIITSEMCSLHPAGLEPCCFKECPDAIKFLKDHKLHQDVDDEDVIYHLYQMSKSLSNAAPFLKRCFKVVIDYLEGN